MKRFIIIECDDQMSTMFVSVHNGPSVCMTPLVARDLTEQRAQAVSAVSTQDIVGAPLTREELLAVLDGHVFNAHWKLNTDWCGNRVRYVGPIAEPAGRVDQDELILCDLPVQL
jgi:hypothetical protein